MKAMFSYNFDFSDIYKLLKETLLVDDIKVFNPLFPMDLLEFDLIVFPGGEDVTPELYGEKNYRSSNYFTRDMLELSALKLAQSNNKKIFGICRGHQFINAMLGGKLKQHLYHDSIHRLEYNYIDSFEGLYVNSLHHQGVINPGKDLNGLAGHGDSDDDLIYEIIEGKNILTVQFHPEYGNFPRDTYKVFMKYFQEFLDK